MDHKIIFEISQVDKRKTNPLSEEEKQTKLKAKEEKKAKDKREKLIAATAGMVVKRVGNEAANMVGELTGNYMLQDQISNITTVASYTAAIMINPVVGLTALALDVGSSAIKENISRVKQQYSIGYMRDLTGTSDKPLESKMGRGV